MNAKCTLVAVTLVVLAGCQSGANPPPVFLAQVANLSGSDRAGKHTEQGIRLALKQLTDADLASSLQGRPLQVRHADTRGQLDAYEAEAVRLVSLNRVGGLIGGYTGEEVTRLDHGQVPLLALAGVRPPGVSELTFAIGRRPAQQAFILAKHAADDMDVAEVVIVADERREEFVTTADAFARSFTQARQARGKMAPTPSPLRYGKDANWDELAKAILARGPVGAILWAGRARDWAAIRPRLLPIAATLFFAGDDGDTAELQGTTGNAAILLATAFAPDANAPRMQAFLQKYRDAFKEDADVAAALGCEALQLHAEGLKHASGSWTIEKFAAGLREIKDYPGLAGMLSVTADQHVRRPLYLARLDGSVLTMVKRYEPDALP